MPTTPRKGRKSLTASPKDTKPTAFSKALMQYLLDEGVWDMKYWPIAQDLIKGLVDVMWFAAFGSKRHLVQLEAIQKVIRPARFEVPQSKIDELANKYETSPSLARGWELIKLMSCLTYLMEPVHKNRNSLSDPVKLMEKPILTGAGKLLDEIVEHTRKYWKRGSTLQSMTIRMYIDYLQREGITDADATISERSLKRDLQAAREWEKHATDEDRLARGIVVGRSLSGDTVTWYHYSEGWKTKRKQRTGRKQKKPSYDKSSHNLP